MYPDRKSCLRIMDQHQMMPHIKSHSVMVAKAAVKIGEELNRNGLNLNIDLIEASALLHDITKTRSIKTGENHSKTGGELLRQLGQPRIAEMVEQHVLPDKIEGTVSEEEILCYADKRVLHDKIVSLEKRFEYLIERYGKNSEKIGYINKTKRKLILIEKRIMENITSSEFDINRIVK